MATQGNDISICPVATNNGVRLYTNMADGTVVAEADTTTESEIHAAQQSGDWGVVIEKTGWYQTGSFDGCGPNSAMCSCTINRGVALVFYESDGQIRYITDEDLPLKPATAQANSTPAAKSTVPDMLDSSTRCMSGSQLAVVANKDASQLMLFYQDTEGYIVCRSATSTNLNWGTPERICKAVAGSGLAAVAWNELNNIRVYYQDEDYGIQEYCGDFDGNWSTGSTVTTKPTALTTIGAVSWWDTLDYPHGPQIRLYYHQASPSTIVQKRCLPTEPAWVEDGEAIIDLSPGKYDVHVFARDFESAWPVLTVWAAAVVDQKRILKQRNFALKMQWNYTRQFPLPRTDGN